MYTYSTSIEAQLSIRKWSTLWIFTDGVNHAVFLAVLVAMMWLWAPSAITQRYAYSYQLEMTDSGKGGAVRT